MSALVVLAVSAFLFLDERHADKEVEIHLTHHEQAHLCREAREEILFLRKQLRRYPADAELEAQLEKAKMIEAEACNAKRK